MLQPLCRYRSSEAEMIVARTGSFPNACFKTPAKSSASRFRMMSASRNAAIASLLRRLLGWPQCSGWSVGKTAPALIVVTIRAPTVSAKATRSSQAPASRATRPTTITGCEAARKSSATRFRPPRPETRKVGESDRFIELLFLNPDVEANVDRSVRRGTRDLCRADDRLDRRLRGAGLIVPLRIVAHERSLIGGRVNPVDPGTALRRVDRPGRAQDDERHSIAPGVEARHRGVHQPDVAVDDREHRLAGDLRIPLCDRDRMLLMQTQEHLGVLVAEIVDDTVVQPAVACTRDERRVPKIELTQDGGDRIAAPTHLHLRLDHSLASFGSAESDPRLGRRKGGDVAEIVCTVGVPHTPHYPSLVEREGPQCEVARLYRAVREHLEA